MVVVDADVMIEVLRKNPAVASYLRNDTGLPPSQVMLLNDLFRHFTDLLSEKEKELLLRQNKNDKKSKDDEEAMLV